MQDPLFPQLPEDLASLDDEALSDLLKEHEVAADLIDNEAEDFTKGLDGAEILAQYAAGVEQIEKIHAEQAARVEAQEAYAAEKAKLSARRKGRRPRRRSFPPRPRQPPTKTRATRPRMTTRTRLSPRRSPRSSSLPPR